MSVARSWSLPGRPRSLHWWISRSLALFALMSAALVASLNFSSQRLIHHPYWVEMLRSVSADHQARVRQGQEDSLPQTGPIRSWYTRRLDDARLPAHLRDLPPGLYSSENPPRFLTDFPVTEELDSFQDVDSFHALVVDLPAGRLVTMVDIEALESQQNRDARLSSLWAIAMCAGMAGLIVWLQFSLVRPVRDLADRMRSIEPGTPGQRLPVHGGREEIQVIAQASNQHLARVEQFIAREKSLLDQASHEFRTPIAVIAGAVDVLGQMPLPATSKPALDRIRHAATDLSETTVALLYLAREADPAAEPTDLTVLHELLPRLVADHEHLLHDAAVKLRLATVEASIVAAPEAMVRIAIGNLLRNAIENTAAGDVVVRLTGGVLSIADSGQGFDPVEAARRYREGLRNALPARGQGLGLYLIGRICERYGWQLSMNPAAQGGTHAVLDFGHSIVEPSEP